MRQESLLPFKGRIKSVVDLAGIDQVGYRTVAVTVEEEKNWPLRRRVMPPDGSADKPFKAFQRSNHIPSESSPCHRVARGGAP
jgi:hypothetical protein